jgi:hypothetical protein
MMLLKLRLSLAASALGGVPTVFAWIMATGRWDDAGRWDDTAQWVD